MTPNAPVDWLARRDHPRLTVIALVGAGLAVLGGVVWLTVPPANQGVKLRGLRLASLGLIAFTFAVSGLIAFAIFERRFD